MPVPSGSSDGFFADVRRFFDLLDLDGDGLLSYGEATLGLHECFDAVHRVSSPPSSSSASRSLPSSSASQSDALPAVTAGHKRRVVSEQVHWLFSATQQSVPAPSPSSPSSPSSPAASSPRLPSPLSLASFSQCYQRLLCSAYEQEVLWLDLRRGITALSSSPHWHDVRTVSSRARRVWAERLQGRQQGSSQQADRQQRVVERIAHSCTRPAPQQLTRALQRMSSQQQPITEESWMQAWHDACKTADDSELQQMSSALDAELNAAEPSDAGRNAIPAAAAIT